MQADETQDNPVTDTVSAAENLQVSKPTGKNQENKQQRKNAQGSQIPSEHVSKRQTKSCTSHSTSAPVQMKRSYPFLTDKESSRGMTPMLTWRMVCNSHSRSYSNSTCSTQTASVTCACQSWRRCAVISKIRCYNVQIHQSTRFPISVRCHDVKNCT